MQLKSTLGFPCFIPCVSALHLHPGFREARTCSWAGAAELPRRDRITRTHPRSPQELAPAPTRVLNPNTVSLSRSPRKPEPKAEGTEQILQQTGTLLPSPTLHFPACLTAVAAERAPCFKRATAGLCLAGPNPLQSSERQPAPSAQAEAGGKEGGGCSRSLLSVMSRALGYFFRGLSNSTGCALHCPSPSHQKRPERAFDRGLNTADSCISAEDQQQRNHIIHNLQSIATDSCRISSKASH